MPGVIIQKLTSTEGFVAFDLDDAPAAGVVRSAPKILVDGASLLARSLTYRLATFQRKVGGASAGVNAPPDGTAASTEGFDEATVASAWAEHGTALVSQLSSAPGKAWEIFGVAADVLVAGSKPGVIDDSVATGLSVGTVVPSGPVPVTAKG